MAQVTPGGTPRPKARRIATIAAVAVSLLAAAGCSTASNTGDGGTGSAAPVTLQMLVHANPPAVDAFKAIAADYKAKTGVTVEVTGVPLDDFFTVRNSRISGGKLDITEGINSGGASPNPEWVSKSVPEKDWIREVGAGNWVDLTGSDFLQNWSPGALDALRTNGKDYLVPTGLSFVTGVLYNKKIFADNGLQVPQTWSDFVKVSQTLQSKGIVPVGMGGKDQWPVGLPVLGLVQSLFPDMVALDKGMWDGSFKMNDPKSVELLDKLKTLYSFTQPNFAGVDYGSIPSLFASGKVAMIPDGNWTAPAIEKANPDMEFGVFPFPGSDNPADNQIIGGKLDASLAIPTSSKNQEEAKKFLAFYSAPENYSKFVQMSQLGAAQPNIKATPFLDEISKFTGEKGFVPSWDQVWHAAPDAGPNIVLPWAYQLLAPMGTIDSPAEVANQMEEAWSKAIAG